jgi:hypothetical protein
MSFRSTLYKDKKKYVEARERWKKGYRLRTGGFKWRTRWSEEDIKRVMEHNIPDRELSKEICHSVSSIHRKRWEIKRNSRNLT